MKELLTIDTLIEEAKMFCKYESEFENLYLFGVTDGKAVGTFIEHKFRDLLLQKYSFNLGSSASGIDIPDESINTDIKVTSIKQPQSSCSFRNARQKVYGLGYNLLLFVYEKKDYPEKNFSKLNFLNCAFVEKHRTADYTTTKRLRQMIQDGANKEDILGFLSDRNIPADEITLNNLAEEIMKNIPEQGYLTVSNALQWRLQYGRIVELDEKVEGIKQIIQKGRII